MANTAGTSAITGATPSRLRALPWGGWQYRAKGVRPWSNGFETLELHPRSLEPVAGSRLDRFTRIDDALAWAAYESDYLVATLFERPLPPEPAVEPVEIVW